MLLLIDTSIENASVCLLDQGQIIAEMADGSQKNHAAFIQPAIKSLLQQQNLYLQNIEAVSVMSGPGSYTGLRVGMASAKGLCYALNIPLITISTLEAMAASIIEIDALKVLESNSVICPMIDARRMEVYTALYDMNLNIIMKPQAMILDMESLAQHLEDHRILFTGNGCEKFPTMFEHRNVVVHTLNNYNTGFASLSSQYWLSRKFSDIAYAEPEYLKGIYIHSK